MSGKIERPELGPMELVWALTVCSEETKCADCPFCTEIVSGCGSELKRQAAQMIGRLYDAGEKTVDGLTRKLVNMAREGNTALERGLEGVNQAKLAEMTGVQDELEAFGRDSVIRAEPAGRQDGSVRIVEVIVGGVTAFRAEGLEGRDSISIETVMAVEDARELLGAAGGEMPETVVVRYTRGDPEGVVVLPWAGEKAFEAEGGDGSAESG